MVTAPLQCISLQASDIFFCIRCDYLQDQTSAGSLFKELMFCTHYAFLPAFLRFVQNVWKANAGIFFLDYSAYMNFFSLNFPLHEFFWYFAPSPPPKTFLMVRPLARLITSSESQGRSVGSGKTAAKVFTENGQESSWDATLNEQVPRLIRMLFCDWAHKIILCAIRSQNLSGQPAQQALKK